MRTSSSPIFRVALASVVAFALPALHAAELELPDPLTFNSREKVASAAQWREQRRGEILELFRTNVYGRAPVGRPENLKFEQTETSPDVMDGQAVRKQIKISYHGPGGEGAIQLVLFIPKARTPAPCFLLICNRPQSNIDPTREVKSPFWPAEQIIARGYAAAAFFNGDVAPDKADAWQKGAHKIFDSPQRAPDAWGTIAAWAWGASRCLDYLETDPGIDGKRVAVVGHSRGGKTALWAGAEDPRFAMVVSNDSGCTGAAIARGKTGEHIDVINKAFPHWFCENYKRYNGREADLPVDQHELAALIAPRLLYIASASEDTWADPTHEFLSAVQATPVYRLLGLHGLTATQMPAPDSPLHEGEIGYHVRTGKHDLTEYDWKCYMDFADQHLGRTPSTR
jgi:hypothetical protein